MISSPVASTRNVVPRWRSLRRTVQSRELAMPKTGEPWKHQPLSEELRIRKARWRLDPNVVSAAELVEIGLTEGNEPEAITAAKALLDGQFTPTSLVREQAHRLLERQGEIASSADTALKSLQTRLHAWRLRTRNYTRDALAWVELSRLQLASGEKEDAIRSMQVAKQLAPTDRHVIRSATRMFLHLHQNEVAHDLLKKCERTKHDPWLTAAEIAVASHRGKPPLMFKNGESFISAGKYFPHQYTELAAALGTILLRDGSRKRGRKMIGASLSDPTGNTLAQVEWISANLREDRLIQGVSALRTSSDASEARSIHSFRMGQFDKALEFAVEWLDEEPYSNRAHVAAVAAAGVLEDFDRVIELANVALKFDPTSAPILHNKVYALACVGHLDDAEKLLELTDKIGGHVAHVGEANRGLIAMRRGLTEIGLAHYKSAIAGFKRDNALYAERSASSFLAREAARAQLPIAEKLVSEAEKKLGKEDFHARKVIDNAKALLAASKNRPTS